MGDGARARETAPSPVFPHASGCRIIVARGVRHPCCGRRDAGSENARHWSLKIARQHGVGPPWRVARISDQSRTRISGPAWTLVRAFMAYSLEFPTPLMVPGFPCQQSLNWPHRLISEKRQESRQVFSEGPLEWTWIGRISDRLGGVFRPFRLERMQCASRARRIDGGWTGHSRRRPGRYSPPAPVPRLSGPPLPTTLRLLFTRQRRLCRKTPEGRTAARRNHLVW